MQDPTYARAATIIDLEEHTSLDPLYPSDAVPHSSQAYYAIDTSSDEHKAKKRKIERACDFCRRRKTKCDGPKMQDNVCTNCAQTGRRCTYIETSKPRGPPKAYVTALEDRVEKAEALLKRLRPEADFTAELGPPIPRDSWRIESTSAQITAQASSSSSAIPPPVASSSHCHILLPLTTAIPPPGCSYRGTGAIKFKGSSSPTRHRRRRRTQDPPFPKSSESGSNGNIESSTASSLSGSDNEDSAVELSLVQGMTHLTLRGLRPAHVQNKQATDGQWRFHGKSSSLKLINAARELKQRRMDEVVGGVSPKSTGTSSSGTSHPGYAPRRSQYWNSLPWEISFEGADRTTTTPSFVMAHFPPLDLADSLIDLYFTRNNSLFPLLHRPTFDKQWAEGLYQTDLWFATVCMAMFAVSSRWSSDPRVLPDDVAENPTEESNDGIWALAGWKFVDVALDVHRRRRSLFLPANLFEVQTLVLMAMYFRGTVAHAESWTLVSIGIRKAQDVGAHRRKVYGRKPTIEEELWKRTIWHLIAIDRLGSMLIGRPCCSRDEDFDLDLPLEVDDEFWENDNPEHAFQQPAGKPALVTAFVYWVKLSQISAFALRTLYAIGRSKQPLGLVGPKWREETVAQLNEAMLGWIDSLPPHLKWSPTMGDDVFASQSAMLHMSYYIVQITIYRPFIPVPRIPTPGNPSQNADAPDKLDVSLSALSICANAAKAGTSILEVLLHRGFPRHTVLVHYAFLYAGVLLVSQWTQMAKDLSQSLRQGQDVRAEKPLPAESQMEELLKLVSMLNGMRPRWELAREAGDRIIESLPTCSANDPAQAIEHVSNGNEESRLHSGDRTKSTSRLYYPSSGSSFDEARQTTYSTDASSSGAVPSPLLYRHTTCHPHESSSDELSQLWPMPDIPVSASRASFSIPEAYSSQEEWPLAQPQWSFRRNKEALSFGGPPSVPDQLFHRPGEYSMAVPETPGFRASRMNTVPTSSVGSPSQLPYIKHERTEEDPLHLPHNSIPYTPSYRNNGRSPAEKNSYRPSSLTNVDEGSEHWNADGHRRGSSHSNVSYLYPA